AAAAVPALACAAPAVIPRAALGLGPAVAPSDRITLGCIGIGCMGQGHLQQLLTYEDAQVVAVCDVDTWRRDTAQRTVDEAYAARRDAGQYAGCAAYVDFRDVLARDDIDAVLIALGDRWHAAATVLAAEAGKDIYVEKPVSLTIAQARAMVEAVRGHGRVCQVGLQQRSAPEFHLAARLVQAGALGRVRHIYTIHNGVSADVDLPAEPTPATLEWDLWLGPAPWRPFHHRLHHLGQPKNVVPWEFVRDFGGGGITSGCVHALDVVQWALGRDASGPQTVVAPESGTVPCVTFHYDDGVEVQITDGRLDRRHHEIPEGWDEQTSLQPFGGLYVGDDGWLHVGRGGFLTSHPADILRDHTGYYDRRESMAGHHRNWLDCIRTRRRPHCDIAVGAQSTIMAHLGCLARWLGRPLHWDPVREEFASDDEANRLRRRAMREPWRV
ncbi:MAG: Gfo/Idh/MocA family oxidoreductase, partial [Pirellulaceae bacterium]|nr:Gfo/Idh/MocA family oxidoreductase [Pirellulaceae bacterium]